MEKKTILIVATVLCIIMGLALILNFTGVFSLVNKGEDARMASLDDYFVDIKGAKTAGEVKNDESREYVKEWNFDNSPERWSAANSLKDFNVKDGILDTAIAGDDAYMVSPGNLNIDAGAVKYVELKIRSSVDGRMNMFFTTDKGLQFAEDKRGLEYNIVGGNDFQTILMDMSSIPMWKSKIKSIRFDIDGLPVGTKVEFDSIKIFKKAPSIQMTPLFKAEPVIYTGEKFSLGTTITNNGGYALDDIELNIELPRGLKLVEGSKNESLKSLAINKKARKTWSFKADAAGLYTVTLKTSAKAHGSKKVITPVTERIRFGVGEKSAEIDTHKLDSVDTGVIECGNGSLVLKNSKVALAFPKSSFGFTDYKLYVKGDKGWTRVGVSEDIAHINYLPGNNESRIFSIYPKEYEKKESDGSAEIIFSGKMGGEIGWNYNFSFSLKKDGYNIKTAYDVSSDSDVKIAGFYGPTLLVDKEGKKKVDALFPGLEWLTADESSSNTLDIDPPGNLKLVPAWFRITVPSMAVSTGDYMAGLVWDANQKWDGKNEAPSAVFSSPNWFMHQKDHLMGLFVPSMKSGGMSENDYRSLAGYDLSAGKKLHLEAYLTGRPNQESLAIVDSWLEAFGTPKLQDTPRSMEDEIKLCREGFTKTVWDANTKQWKHACEFGAEDVTSFATELWVDSLLTKDAGVKEQLRQQVNAATKRISTSNWSNNAASHFPDWDLPFYIGGLEPALDSIRSRTFNIKGSRDADDIWSFNPGDDPAKKNLGKAGQTENGLIAGNTLDLLIWARETGDETSLKAGIKGLEYVEKNNLHIPRAGQSWECVLHTPDILAAAKLARSYIEAYRATGEAKYLENAKYWGKAGIPFIYFWGINERPIMKGATTAIFGASQKLLSSNWMGRPVQWNGLIYAYSILQLAQYDNSYPWKDLAELIIRSAMWQQSTDAGKEGTFPDSWVINTNAPVGPFINPEDIERSLFALMGNDPGVKTKILKDGDKQIHISSPAEVLSASKNGQVLSAELKYYAGEVCNILIAGTNTPETVYADGKALKETDDLDNAAEGWTQVSDLYTLVKCNIDGDAKVKIEIKESNKKEQAESHIQYDGTRW